ncbi:hypothetical protein HORIV_23410 [Vreelandella olivaria]|uniref:Carbohydrate kinase PfkB domain-containing protein n=1 Tax=Vreelandella olivaria TaxID=390919 RepID=A0ABN5WU55_9GAMM|nr:hypothetical protein HORIV_23410 [Halomonas olivaria]
MSLLLQMTGPVMDLTYNVRAIPASGAEAEVTGFAMVVGGGFNAMAAAHAAGMAVRLGGSIGTGPLAGIVAERLKELGIDCARPAVAGHDQGVAPYCWNRMENAALLDIPVLKDRSRPRTWRRSSCQMSLM